ncbi:MAG: PD40 domain-containing protein, partial [Bacteroidales bacterium]|nr:PD40 domain-containing protein [Bacteroidales bacterium]
MKSNHSKLFILLLFAIAIVSCNPEGGLKNPANYIDYVDISRDLDPDVSPDGKLIAYYHQNLKYPEPQDYPTGLYVMNEEGTNRKLLLKGDHWSPSWSPDGEWLVFTSGGTLQIINIEGDSIRTFQGVNNVPLYFPDWSPDGGYILFSSPYVEGGGFFICEPDFQVVKQLFNLYEFSGRDPNWSPDGSKILYVKYYSKNEELFVIDTAGISDTRLTENDRVDRYPAWSPDGSLITWSSNIEIYLMNSDGSDQRRFDYGRFPAFTPDSKYIIYCNA